MESITHFSYRWMYRQEVLSTLEEVLQDKQLEVRLAAAKGLWNISKNADAVVPVLAELLGGKALPVSDHVDARRMFLQSVIEALCRIGPPADIELRAITAVCEVTPAAATRWNAAPWK